jgi:hypothetical protein
MGKKLIQPLIEGSSVIDDGFQIGKFSLKFDLKIIGQETGVRVITFEAASSHKERGTSLFQIFVLQKKIKKP